MDITIREADQDTLRFVRKGGSLFEVRSKLVLHATDGSISYTVVDVPPYTKQYDTEEFDVRAYLGNPDQSIFLAFAGNEPIGQIRVRKYWNAYAYIDDISVEPEYRGEGIGRALMSRAIEWAKAKGFPGMMLETQDNNVAACRLYERCGFQLRGFDTHLYKANDPGTEEIALYWYLIF
jgi:ribosomal protein S18 acetylase RimI-like enzyme